MLARAYLAYFTIDSICNTTMSVDAKEMGQGESLAGEVPVRKRWAIIRNNILEEKKRRQEMTMKLHKKAVSNPELQERYSKRKIAAVKYSLYKKVDTEKASINSFDVYCK